MIKHQLLKKVIGFLFETTLLFVARKVSTRVSQRIPNMRLLLFILKMLADNFFELNYCKNPAILENLPAWANLVQHTQIGIKLINSN